MRYREPEMLDPETAPLWYFLQIVIAQLEASARSMADGAEGSDA